MKKYFMGIGAALVGLFIISHILSLREGKNTCRLVSSNMGIWSKYGYKPEGLLALMVPDGLGYDKVGRSAGYEIPFEILNTNAPQLTESVFSEGKDLSGVVHPLSALSKSAVDHHRRYYPDAPYIETEGGLFWLEDLASYSVYIGKPTTVDEQSLWDRQLGSCTNLPKSLPQYRPYGSEAFNHLESCDFDFNYGTLNIQYGFKNAEFQNYKLIEEFLKSELICKI